MIRKSDSMKNSGKIHQYKKLKTILIYCEGEKTEPNYFKSFRQHLHNPQVNIEIGGAGYNTLSLVKKIIELKKEAKKNKEEIGFSALFIAAPRGSLEKPGVDITAAEQRASVISLHPPVCPQFRRQGRKPRFSV
jgi:hypothetical protein